MPDNMKFVNLYFNGDVQGSIYRNLDAPGYTLVWNYRDKPNVREFFPNYIKAFAALRSRTRYPLTPLILYPLSYNYDEH